MNQPCPTITAVICTLRRPDDLRSALQGLIASEPGPDAAFVVDGDAERSAEPVVQELAPSCPFPLALLPSPPGLTRQRNRALDTCTTDVVAFFDDDSVVGPDVFAILRRAYADPGVVGATGLVDEPSSNRVGGKQSRIRRLLPGWGEEGTFTAFGYPNRLVHVDEQRDIEFMQGCFMTARVDAARQLRFDESLPGYGLAEDEDFSCRLARLGRIRYLPDAVVEHRNSGFGDRDRRAFGRQVVVNRAYLFRKNFRPTLAARAGFAGLLAVLVVHRLLNRDWRGAQGLLEGVVQLLRRG